VRVIFCSFNGVDPGIRTLYLSFLSKVKYHSVILACWWGGVYLQTTYVCTGGSGVFAFKSDYLAFAPMEQRALKNVNNCLNTNIYSYIDTPGGQSSNPYLNVVHF
jgi:hypothetical protein